MTVIDLSGMLSPDATFGQPELSGPRSPVLTNVLTATEARPLVRADVHHRLRHGCVHVCLSVRRVMARRSACSMQAVERESV